MNRLIFCGVLASLLCASTARLAPAIAASVSPTQPAKQNTEDAYTRYMRLGYAYTNQFDYNTALINFRRALAARPNDPYATQAVANTEYYIARDRTAIRQRAIDQLEARLTTANEQSDWVCAAATVDELIKYTAPDSFERRRLQGYRGELSGLMDARVNLESWSTVCSPQGPLY
ncbi:MAG: hypothetical protein AAFZ80_07090 [Cyanobacteria bacterium P01_A01_bin.105]